MVEGVARTEEFYEILASCEASKVHFRVKKEPDTGTYTKSVSSAYILMSSF
jgi:hypothetical protein